jgi:hypothetical protein
LKTVTQQTSVFPGLRALASGLASVFGRGRVKLIGREPNAYASYYPSEIVNCQLEDGSELKLLVKYAVAPNQKDRGHRIGLEYEAEVYRQVLEPLKVSAPKLYGTYTDKATGRTWLVLEYLDEAAHAHRGDVQAVAMVLAARWIGQFHVASSALPTARILSLNRYTQRYYLEWAWQTLAFDGHQQKRWLSALCRRYKEAVRLLVEQPLAIIHGDYYADNVLFRRGVIHPYDWERAALAVGEIDLASLTNGWHEELVGECEVEYQQARWPDGPPAEFNCTLDSARLYLLFRLLGEAPGWPDQETRQWRFEQLRSVGERLELI